jgi:hypothetical protein
LATGRQATTDFVGEHDRLSGFGKDNVLQGTGSRISGADFTPETSPMVSTIEEPTGKADDLPDPQPGTLRLSTYGLAK